MGRSRFFHWNEAKLQVLAAISHGADFISDEPTADDVPARDEMLTMLTEHMRQKGVRFL